MKKILSLILALLLIAAVAVSLCSCTPPGEVEEQERLEAESIKAAQEAEKEEETTVEETTVELPFLERVGGVYRMRGLAVYRGDDQHSYTDSGTNELEVEYTVTVKGREDGKADININYGEGGNDEVGEVDEDSSTITFTTPYAFGYEYNCTLTFEEGNKKVSAALHMHVEGDNWQGKHVSEDIDLTGVKK